MKDLEFVTSDFTAAPTGRASEMANWVNAKLKRKLEKAPKVYGGTMDTGCPENTWRFHGIKGDYAWDETHTARLVCIEEIPKGEK